MKSIGKSSFGNFNAFEIRLAMNSVETQNGMGGRELTSKQGSPRWASGLGTSIKYVNGKWINETPNGPIEIRFAPRNDLGVLAHFVIIAPGLEVSVPMRVVPNGSISELSFTLFRQPGMTDQKFKEDAEWVLRDLTRLKDLLEKS